jgi:hypothetical protein
LKKRPSPIDRLSASCPKRGAIKDEGLDSGELCPRQFDIVRHIPKGFRATPKKEGWMKSNAFEKLFRLTQGINEYGDPEYTLAAR